MGHPAVDFQLAHGKRAEASGIARDDDAVMREEDEREGAFELQEGIAKGGFEGLFAGVRDEVEDDFGVAGGLEDGAAGFEICAEFGGVGDVAVVGDGDAAFVAVDGERLGVADDGVAGGGVAGVADGERAGKVVQDGGREDVGHMAHRLFGVDQVAVSWRRCRRFPARGAGARRGKDRRAWRLRGGRRWLRLRILRAICRQLIDLINSESPRGGFEGLFQIGGGEVDASIVSDL